MTENALHLTVDYHVAEAVLTMVYRVENTSRETAWLLNRLWRGTPAVQISPQLIYVTFERATRTVRLAKELASLPTDRTVTTPVAPFVTGVRAGETFQETVRLSLPLVEYQEYDGARTQVRPARYGAVVFCLGFYWSAPGVTETQRVVGDTAVVLPVFPAGTRPVFGRLCTRPHALALPVLEPLE